MLTNRENKVISDIMTGRMQKRKILATAFLLLIFLINLLISINMKNKKLNTLEKLFQNSNSVLLNMETRTQKEQAFKTMLVNCEKESHSLTTTLVARNINLRIYFLSCIIFMVIIYMWVSSYHERIIRKLQEERQNK
jgi:hypothetical protein